MRKGMKMHGIQEALNKNDRNKSKNINFTVNVF